MVSNTRSQLVILVLIGLAALLSLSSFWRLFASFDILALVATIFGGIPIYRETVSSIRHRHINMEVSMTVAIIASLIIGAFFAAVVITFFVTLAEYIEQYALDKARATVAQLEKMTPRRALVRREGKEVEVDVQTLALNETVIVRDGERIPVDGVIIKGYGAVNQASITGESLPIDKSTGDSVYAGSIDESGLFEVRTDKIGTETVFGKIIKLVEEAEGKRAPIQKISDKLATRLVYFAILSSLVTFIITGNPVSSISVVIVAGACGVAAGTPLAVVASMGKAAKRGVIVKGGIYLEEMTKIDTVVIDKTGTLTLGEPTVESIQRFDGCTDQEVISYAAMAEAHSNHPISRAILRKAGELRIAPVPHSEFRYTPGRGIVSDHNGEQILVGNRQHMIENGVKPPAESSERKSAGLTTVLVAHNGEICGSISLADNVREDSRKAVESLKKMGLRTIMLTGDNDTVAKAVADRVGADEVYADLLPQDKVSIIEDLVAKGHRVAMVGDGINDAPALARANVGIGMGAGTHIAVEEADVVLMTNDLQKIPSILRLSKTTYNTILTNFYGTIGIDGIGVILAFMGLLNPVLAALIHTISELVFLANSAKLMR